MFTDRDAHRRSNQREKQPWPADRPFRILSLDGGGIKGVFTARLLALIERHLGGLGLGSRVELISGTSTGGIIALGLALDMPAEEIMRFYREDGRRIFPTRSWVREFKHWIGAKHDYELLEIALQRCFGEHRLGDARPRLVIPAFSVPKTQIAVLKTDHHADYRHEHSSFAWEVARATSAAPTYFRGHEHPPSQTLFLDGGIWANNPIMLAVVEALTAYDISVDQIQIVSIGTGNPPYEISLKQASGGLIHWRSVIRAAMHLTTDSALSQARLLLGPERVLRLVPEGENASIQLDDYDRAWSQLPDAAERAFKRVKPELEQFFATPAEPRERHYSRPQIIAGQNVASTEALPPHRPNQLPRRHFKR